MKFDFIHSFPEGYTPNSSQQLILEEISHGMEKKKKFIIIQAPTATGKSHIAKSFCNYSKNPSVEYTNAVESGEIFSPMFEVINPEDYRFGTSILTCTKSLQDQYEALFSDGSSFKGKSNYPCALSDELSCENGACIGNKKMAKGCLNKGRCPYFNARAAAALNKCQFLNYSVFMSMMPGTRYKDFIICDEASELETLLVNEFTAIISLNLLKKNVSSVASTPAISASKSSYYAWLLTCKASCESQMNLMEEKFTKKSKFTDKEYSMYVKTKEYYYKFSMLVDAWNKTNYIIKREDDILTFIPYEVDQLAKNIFDYGKTIILMSATIVDHKNFAKTLGITDYHYIEAPCALDAKKAPIKCSDKYRVSHQNKLTTLPILAKIAKQICEMHKGQKGIIHTHSMEILNYVKKEMGKSTRFLYREPGISNEDIFYQHKTRFDDTILVSPSMTHGIDLKDNLGEFQIILKAPYVSLGDMRVKKKFDEDKVWYQNQMLSTLIQACGRCNRTKDDYAVTYILDGVAVDAIRKNYDKLPTYFKDRLK